MSKAGERPGKGRYTCVICGHVVFLESNDESLSVCPSCGSYHFAP